MTDNSNEPLTYRFGPFELDVAAVEFRKHGTRIRLQQKPFQALTLLLGKPGVLVTRDELRARLWANDTFVEFDDSLNHVIKRLRDALIDSADAPRFIETVPGSGYRFIARVETIERSESRQIDSAGLLEGQTEDDTAASFDRAPFGNRRRAIGLALAGMLVATTAVAYWFGGRGATVSPAAGGDIKRPVVAVLPLSDLSEDRSQSFFALAMTDELIARLAKIGGLRVISRTSTMHFEDSSDYTLPEIARKLGATHVVEGSVVRAGDQIRVTAQLIDASLDQHIWSETYTRDLNQIIQLQGEVALHIAREIHVELTPREEDRLAAAPSVRPDVYEAYMEARSLFDAALMQEAIEAFQHVIDLDPDFAPAYSWLADSYSVFGWWRGPPADLLPKAKLVALKARELDESLADPHLLLGKMRAFFEWEWEDAEQHYQRALEVNPNYAKAYLGYGVYLVVLGRHQEAIRMAQQAVEVDPLSASTLGAAGDIYYFADEPDKAVSHYQSAIELQPNGALWYSMMGCAYTDKGDFENTHRSLEKAIPLAGADARPKSILAWSYARAGKVDKARELLDELDRLPLPENATHYFKAVAYLAVGDIDSTFTLLDRAVEEHWGFIGTVVVASPYDEIRSDPRYAKLMSKIGLNPSIVVSPGR